jgi:hypothetical protein
LAVDVIVYYYLLAFASDLALFILLFSEQDVESPLDELVGVEA